MARDAEAAMAKTTAIRVIANLVRLEVLVWRRMEFMKASPGKTKNSFASRIPIRASVFWHGPLANWLRRPRMSADYHLNWDWGKATTRLN